MNNVKVRIYELSKELNLENRDILAVCERLNIAVKSHSSTITESDAQRIEKYVETHPIENHPDSKSEGGSHSSKLSDSLDHPKKKQQILEIRKPKLQVNSNSQGFSTPENHSEPQPATQAPPSVPFPSSSEQPTLLERPVLSKPNTAPQSPLKPVSEPQAEVSEDNNSPVKPETLVLESNQPDSLQLSPADEIAPELVSPPVRPPEPSSVQPAVVKNKPILKSNKPAPKSAPAQQPAAKTSDKPTPKPTKSRPASPGPKSSDSKEPKKIKEVKRGERTPRKEITALKPQPSIPQLQPPPNRASNDLDPDLNDNEEGNEETQDDLLLSTDGDIDLEVKRPKKTLTAPKKQLTRPGSKKSAWEEEEEDPNKAAKVNKAKRPRKPMIDEDDEDDFEGGLSDLSDSNPALTLSLARPPKPKNGSSSPKPPTSSVKKPAPIRGGSSSDNGSSKSARHTEPDKPQRPEILVLSGAITIQELANTLVVPVTEIIKRLFTQGIAVNITETLDLNIIEMICEEFEVVLETEQEKAAAEKPDNIFNEEDLENLQRRPPVVTIMGHVDHGKTTLLDSIRQAKVAQGEAGGITQHIGAYHVDVEHEGKMQQVVFLDTPGHEAFTAMRARGARVTDIAILVVAADDGVRPQTIEAIGHAKAAGVPIIVAINKIDKESAQPDRVKQELMEHNLVPEEWGGETIMVPVSAINGENLDLLLEMIILVSQVEDLEANPDRAARGAVIETHLDKARGPVATLLVQNGTLRVGDIIVAGSALGKVRAMIDDRGERVDVASPSFAVEILGLRDVPAAGDEFEVFENEKEAAVLANQRSQDQRETRIKRPRSLTNLWLGDEKQGELNIILKTDVQGSVEAIVNALEKLPQKEVELRLLLAAPGEVTETDIDFATASDAVLIGFNTTLANGARQAADQLGVDIREYNIIYNLLDDIQAAMEGLLEPELVPEELGQAEVRAIFPVGRSKVAGCYIQSGKVIRNCKVRVYRKGNKIHEGILDSLKRMREDAKEVNAGYECGMGLDSFNDWEEGDIIEAYRMVTKRRTLSV